LPPLLENGVADGDRLGDAILFLGLRECRPIERDLRRVRDVFEMFPGAARGEHDLQAVRTRRVDRRTGQADSERAVILDGSLRQNLPPANDVGGKSTGIGRVDLSERAVLRAPATG
jgi:hypothetical protein